MIQSFTGWATFDHTFVRVICRSKNKSSVNTEDVPLVSSMVAAGLVEMSHRNALKWKGSSISLTIQVKAGKLLIQPVHKAVSMVA